MECRIRPSCPSVSGPVCCGRPGNARPPRRLREPWDLVSEAEQQPARRTRADRWATRLAAARQFYAREGHLNAPRKQVEEMAGEGGEVTAVRLGGGGWTTRRRAGRLPAGRRAELDALGMHWEGGRPGRRSPR
ncbi:helicase associated domain-containing protein [Streptomyces mirabilis]|uniref:helicase associated domain-containing protein n=1 Tax=Streptomyces mirabilis TaxID=68239 RepID=UPI00369B7258